MRVPRDPAQMVERALGLIRDGRVQNKEGSWRDVPTHTICIHGDTPNAPEIAKTVRGALEAEGIEIVGLRDMVAA